jgi:hypothetical protein
VRQLESKKKAEKKELSSVFISSNFPFIYCCFSLSLFLFSLSLLSVSSVSSLLSSHPSHSFSLSFLIPMIPAFELEDEPLVDWGSVMGFVFVFGGLVELARYE